MNKIGERNFSILLLREIPKLFVDILLVLLVDFLNIRLQSSPLCLFSFLHILSFNNYIISVFHLHVLLLLERGRLALGFGSVFLFSV